MNEKQKLIAALEAIGFKVRTSERYIDISMGLLNPMSSVEANICIDKGIPTVTECIKEWGYECYLAGDHEGRTSCY